MKDYLVRVSSYAFDPAEGLPEVPEDLQDLPPGQASPDEAGAGQGRYLVQFHAPLDPGQRAQVQGLGLRLVSYVPQLTWVESLSDRQRAAVEGHPLVRAIVPYVPAFKIDPSINRVPARTPERKALTGLPLRVVLFPDADPEAVTEVLHGAGATEVVVLDDRALGGALQIRALVPSPDAVPVLARQGGVRWIEEVAELIEDNVNAAGTIQSGTAATPSIWNQGLHGESQIIGVLDGGPLDINHCFFQDPGNTTPGPAHRKVLQIRNTSGSAADGHATFVAGCAAGDDVNNPGAAGRRGGAWAARLVSGNTADLAGTSLLAELSAAAGMGATIHTNSWHDDTEGAGNPASYNQNAADVDAFTWSNEDHLVLGSAGNNGEEQGPPGTAKNAICCGAAQADPNEMNLGDGNPGPTADGRLKPDLCAVGCTIQSATVNTTCTTGPRAACATSYATPHAAAAAALVRQYYTEGWYPTGAPVPSHAFVPSGALLKATLINGTLDMTGEAGYPSMDEGWGVIRLDNVLSFPASPRDLRVWDTRNVDGLITGESRTHHVDVAGGGQPLRVTLVWTDPPGTAGAAIPVVNDLDLVVTSPDGTQVFRGNVFAGGGSVTGGTADTVNTVELVLVNTPAAGDWDITVAGTAVNVGNPGQGYALVVSGDLAEAPTPSGNQDTLVVRVNFADNAFTPPLPNLQNLMQDVADYIDEVSYGRTTVTPVFRGPLTLDHPRSHYEHPSRNLLIELTEEVVAKLVAAEPTVFDRGTPGAADDIDRIIIVTNDVNFTGDWATTGQWPYDLPEGFTRPLSVSIQAWNNPAARFTHGVLHQLGLVDLYAHPGVVLPRPYVDEWDNMAGLFTNVHPLVWSKERAGWVTGHGSEILYIPRPAAGSSYSGPNPLQLFHQETTATNRKAIAIGLTDGAATMAAERAFYFVEARSNILGGFDDGLPMSGVLIYYVNELIAQGEGPVIVLDKGLLTTSLADAAFLVGEGRTIPGTGITINVLAGTGGAAFDIQIEYVPPVTDYNVSITRGDTIDGRFVPWMSPDIWIDSPKNGFQLAGGPPPHDQREQPVADVVNRLYARIRNAGPGTAFDFDVRFRVSSPYHTVGGEPDFNQFVGIKHIVSLTPGTTDVFVEWTPTGVEDPHNCVLVDLINLVGTDTNEFDNSAQENFDVVASVTASPFHPVDYRYHLTNPYDQPALFYFRATGAPQDWDLTLTPRKILLGPGEQVTGALTVQPPENAEVCTSERIVVTSWTPRGDTIVPVGGGIVQVNLARPTVLTLTADAGQCDGRDLELLFQQLKEQGKEFDPEEVRRRCRRITTQGCTNPPLPHQEVIVTFVDPYGNPVFRTVKTDEDGCFEDFLVTADGGNWQVTAEYPGDRCQGPATSRPVVVCFCP